MSLALTLLGYGVYHFHISFSDLFLTFQTILRGLQNRGLLEQLLTSVVKVRDELVPANVVSRKPKLVLKVSPDLDESQLVDIADVVKASKIDGVIVSNTTIQRPANLI